MLPIHLSSLRLLAEQLCLVFLWLDNSNPLPRQDLLIDLLSIISPIAAMEAGCVIPLQQSLGSLSIRHMLV